MPVPAPDAKPLIFLSPSARSSHTRFDSLDRQRVGHRMLVSPTLARVHARETIVRPRALPVQAPRWYWYVRSERVRGYLEILGPCCLGYRSGDVCHVSVCGRVSMCVGDRVGVARENIHLA